VASVAKGVSIGFGRKGAAGGVEIVRARLVTRRRMNSRFGCREGRSPSLSHQALNPWRVHAEDRSGGRSAARAWRVGLRGFAVPDEVVRRASVVHTTSTVHLLEDSWTVSGPCESCSLASCQIPSAVIRERLGDAEVPAQLKVSPHIQRVAQGWAGGGPGFELLEVGRAFARDEVFGNAVGRARRAL